MGKRNTLGKVAHCLQNVYRKIKPNKSISLSQSFFRGFVTFLVLSYTKFTLVTFTLLKPTYLYGPGGKGNDIVVITLMEHLSTFAMNTYRMLFQPFLC